jgi:ribosomal protein L40E
MTSDGQRMNELFDEEGFSAQVAAVCPACRAEMPAGSVLCTKCGYNKQTGTRLDGHKTAGVDISHGTLALMKAKADMEKAKRLDDSVLAGAGMPWWMLSLVLFMLISGLSIAVLAVNASRRVDETISFNPMATFLILSGSAFCAFSIGSFLLIAKRAFGDDKVKGALCVLPPYTLYYAFKNPRPTWKPLLTSIVLGAIGIGLITSA